jgi:hypothetical protein
MHNTYIHTHNTYIHTYIIHTSHIHTYITHTYIHTYTHTYIYIHKHTHISSEISLNGFSLWSLFSFVRKTALKKQTSHTLLAFCYTFNKFYALTHITVSIVSKKCISCYNTLDIRRLPHVSALWCHHHGVITIHAQPCTFVGKCADYKNKHIWIT